MKTVHNGIKYGIEQILAEGYDLMKQVKGMNGDQMADVLAQWNATEELSSAVEITEVCLRTDPVDGRPGRKDHGSGRPERYRTLDGGRAADGCFGAHHLRLLNGRVMSSMKPQRMAAE